MRHQKFLAALTAVVVTAAIVHAHAPFSLDAEFAAVDSESRSTAITGDVFGMYQDLVDGVESFSNDYGNIRLDTTASTRTVCMTFGEVVQQWRPDLAHPAPGTGCHAVTITTLANADGGVTDVVAGDPKDKGLQIRWTGPTADGNTADFMLAFGYHTVLPYEADRLLVTCTNGAGEVCDEWTLEPFVAPEVDDDPRVRDDEGHIIGPLARIFAAEALKGNRTQLIPVAEYVMPMQLVLSRADVNHRAVKPKGRK